MLFPPRVVMESSLAISRLESPLAIRRRTSSSRLVNPKRAAAAALADGRSARNRSRSAATSSNRRSIWYNLASVLITTGEFAKPERGPHLLAVIPDRPPGPAVAGEHRRVHHLLLGQI